MGTRPSKAKSNQWKTFESDLAKFFNSRRRPLSGLNHGTGRGDDAQHPRIYMEAKYGRTHPAVEHVWELYDHTAKKCEAETQNLLYPILGLKRTSRQGFLLTVHSSHLEKLSIEFLTQLGYTVSKDDITHDPQ